MKNILLIIGALLPVLSGVIYCVSILRGHTKPQRTARLLLLLISGLSFFVLCATPHASGTWLALASFVQAAVVFVLSLRFGIGGRTTLDVGCFAVCLVGIVAWLWLGQSLIGLVAAIIADFVAIVPALIKTWRLPHTEIKLFYALDCIAALCSMAAGSYDIQDLLYPLYIFVVNGLFVAIMMQSGRGLIGYIRSRRYFKVGI